MSRQASLEEFIEGANKENVAHIARKRPSKKNLLLSISGRENMSKYEKPILVYIKRDIKEDIEKYCAGSNQSIINYLLRKGLDNLIREGTLIVEEVG
jgi:hypothetical protein